MTDQNGQRIIDVMGNHAAKSAIECAVVGGLGIAIVGSPDTPRAELASLLGALLPQGSPVRWARPGMELGRLVGTVEAPGECSLADGGALVLEDAHEMPASALQALRAVIADGEARITSTRGTVARPARFLPVSTLLPCPCGHFGDARRDCRCTAGHVREHRERAFSALRPFTTILVTAMPEVPGEDAGRSLAAMRERTAAALAFRQERAGRGEDMAECPGATALGMLVKEGAFPARGTFAIARALADLDQDAEVRESHVLRAAAMAFRP